MQRISFNKGWKFTFENALDGFNTFGFQKYSDAAGGGARFYDHCNWENVDLPHDWAIRLPKNPLAHMSTGGFPNTRFHAFMQERHSELDEIYSVGWYRKQFFLDPAWEGKRIFVLFEGVFRDAIVFVNGVYLERHTSGYTSFALDLTDHLVPGEENSLAVRVDSEQFEGWWYEGAGIYRNVWLMIGEAAYLKNDQTVVRAELNGRVEASAVLVNDSPDPVEQTAVWRICDAQGQEVAHAEGRVTVGAYGEAALSAELTVADPRLWSIETPTLYTLHVSVGEERTAVRFGFRSVAFDPDRGFLLNGKAVKVRGACVHQDLGGVGIALTDNLQYYKIRRLKEMGVNAYRCAHHAPAPALLDACDELGMLVMDETRTFGTSPEAVRQLTALIERDRNHPSVFIWSLGNEEFSVQNDAWSHRLMEKMTRLAKALDPTRPVTYGGNNGNNFTGANGAAEIRGINYIRNDKSGAWIDQYHREHPTQPIIGTEEASYVLSRGGAVNDLENGLLDSTGNVTMPWGSTPKGWVKYMEKRDYFAGNFMWTGFDYHGEPLPFPYTKNASSFGTIDLCGMEKPPFYYYQAWWTDAPVLKLTPHWNHKEGDTVTVAVFTNCEEITLAINGRPLETRRVERFDAPTFEVAYEPGVLSVQGKRGDLVLRDELRTAGKVTELRQESVLEAKGDDEVGILEISAYDERGTFCPLASDELSLSLKGGRIVGVGNGDPASMDYEQKPPREEILPITELYGEDGVYVIPPKKKYDLIRRLNTLCLDTNVECFEDDFRLVAAGTASKNEKNTAELRVTLRDVTRYEYVEFERLGGDAAVYLNGRLLGDTSRWHGRQTRNSIRPYRFYTAFAPGDNELKLTFTYDSLNDLPLLSGAVKLGRIVEEPWRVKLHYGKARVFFKTDTPAQLCLELSPVD